MSDERDYVLGTHDDELNRLGLQHAVWRPHCSAAWERAGFTAGQTLLDVGCGPGWASFDLAQIARERGRVVAVDRSRRFLDALEAGAAARGLRNIETHERDLDEQGLPDVQADGAWARWVFAFVREPRLLLERTVGALRSGGTFVTHEYVDYRTWRLSPRSEAFEEFVREVMASWRFCDRVLSGWAAVDEGAKAPLPSYESGSWGPQEAADMLASQGQVWRKP